MAMVDESRIAFKGTLQELLEKVEKGEMIPKLTGKPHLLVKPESGGDNRSFSWQMMSTTLISPLLGGMILVNSTLLKQKLVLVVK